LGTNRQQSKENPITIIIIITNNIAFNQII